MRALKSARSFVRAAALAVAGVLAMATSATPVAQAAPTPVLITEPSALRALEQMGLSFGTRLEGAPGARQANGWLYAHSARYRSLVELFKADLAQTLKQDPEARVSFNAKKRLFDQDWLTSSAARFELVGVVNRMERQSFNPTTCGGFRLVYRLAYAFKRQGKPVASRLPMTLALDYNWTPEFDHGNCQAIAKRWQELTATAGEALAHQVLFAPGPIGQGQTAVEHLVGVQANFQAVRIPTMPTLEIGGQAEYHLSHYKLQGPKRDHFAPIGLMNTPDLALIQKQNLLPELKQLILSPEFLRKLDLGISEVPAKFLSKRAVSISPDGFARLKNRPYQTLFKPSDFAKVDFSKLRLIKSPAGLLRRLDDMTCMGCHQNRSTAGFHLIGLDHASALVSNAVDQAASPHLMGDLSRRRAYVDALASAQKPDHLRWFCERGPDDQGGMGSHCSLGNDPTFASWTCKSDYRCAPIAVNQLGAEVGTCIPKGFAPGQPSQAVRLEVTATGRADQVVGKPKAIACGPNLGPLNMERGFPAGLCTTKSCQPLLPGGACGLLVRGAIFSACMAKDGKTFEDCQGESLVKQQLQSCAGGRPCRDDWVCGRAPGGVSACIPPYFIFQLRVDGHPKIPKT